jgi:glutathione synthase/RimK-type ligase-like ATP-grasp enzyme
MWHFHHLDYRDAIFAKQLIFAIEQKGIKVFPNFQTCWHFDDKVGQKYLLESIAAPMVKSHIFYSKKEALKWINNTSFPKVFKLRGGAGASNVRLVNNKAGAIKVIKKAFGKGFSQYNGWGSFSNKVRLYKMNKVTRLDLIKSFIRIFFSTNFARMHGREKGYVYFQDYIPNNNFDIRIIAINGNFFGIKRMVRENDFRASGSGTIIYSKDEIDIRCIKIAKDVSQKLNTQSIAFDFIFNEKNEPLIIEISYGFSYAAYDLCEGFWDNDLNWHGDKFSPQEWMVEALIRTK